MELGRLTERWHLLYHSIPQVLAGYIAGLIFGSIYFLTTEYVPLHYPSSLLGQLRRGIESLWIGIGGIGGWELTSSTGGWGEGWVVLGDGPDGRKVGKAS
jgi:dolichyldiphosphatase